MRAVDYRLGPTGVASISCQPCAYTVPFQVYARIVRSRNGADDRIRTDDPQFTKLPR